MEGPVTGFDSAGPLKRNVHSVSLEAYARDEILARLRERVVAEDLAQEVLMVLHDKYPEVTRIEDLLPLSLQIMRFKMAGLRRKVQRRGEAGQVSVDDIQV